MTDIAADVPHPQAAPEPGPAGALLVDAEEFTLTLYGAESASLSTAEAFAAVTVIAGAGEFAGVELDMAQTALIPAGRDIDITASGADLRFLVSAPGVR